MKSPIATLQESSVVEDSQAETGVSGTPPPLPYDRALPVHGETGEGRGLPSLRGEVEGGDQRVTNEQDKEKEEDHRPVGQGHSETDNTVRPVQEHHGRGARKRKQLDKF